MKRFKNMPNTFRKLTTVVGNCWYAIYLECTKCHWIVEFKMLNCMLHEYYLNLNQSKAGISCMPWFGHRRGDTHIWLFSLPIEDFTAVLYPRRTQNKIWEAHTRQYCGATGTGQKGGDFLWVRAPHSTLKMTQPEEKAGCLKRIQNMIHFCLKEKYTHTHTWKEVFILFQGYIAHLKKLSLRDIN